MSLEEFRVRLRDGTRETRVYLIAKLMRQAKPDDVFSFIALSEVRALWTDLQRQLGDKLAFWTWLLDMWAAGDHAAQ